MLILSHRFLAIEDTAYTTLEELLSLISAAISAFSETHSDISFVRLGLRYINEIKIECGNPFDWDGYISENLTKALSGIAPQRELCRAMSQTVINKGDHQILFNHGIFNSEFPAPISRKEFILDYDASTSDVEDKSIIDRVKLFNAEVLSMFESSIGDELRSKMGRSTQ